MLLKPRERDIGEMTVMRVLPDARCRSVGPFVFFDHMGPAEFRPGAALAVRPHPHVNLATITYLFDGTIVHRDSLGVVEEIRPGEVNWMTAGRGIVHSERSPEADLERSASLHGIQAWIALPVHAEETEPSFVHHDADELPRFDEGGWQVGLIAGELLGRTSPVETLSPLFYAEARAAAAASVVLGSADAETAVYVVDGSIDAGGGSVNAGQMFVAGSEPFRLETDAGAHVMVLGGPALPEPRHIWWNFVSSRPERIEQARRDWAEGRFDSVPGDDEYIPLPKK
ncbi:MAG: pirin family protein [Pseudomonadota bacterium]